jgi:hypothetical protein
MPVYRINGKAVLFIHIPKCAGTSIESMLLAHPDCAGQGMYEMGKDNLMLKVGRCSPQHYHAEMLNHVLDLSSIDLCFTILRFPLRRLLSEHSMQIVKYPGTKENFDTWYLEMKEQRSRNPFCFDNHLRPAKEFLLPQAYLYNLEIGLETIWHDICERIGITPSLSALLHTRPCNGPLQDDCEVHNDTLSLVKRDYCDDFTIHSTLEREWKPGFQSQHLSTFC